MVGLYFFINRTRTGRAMRAVSEDKDVAAMMGINVDRIILTTFAIGGVLAGAAGILYTLMFNSVHYYMGFLPGIKAFTAAVLGGIGNIIGAALGGLVLGVLEQVGPNLFLLGYGDPRPRISSRTSSPSRCSCSSSSSGRRASWGARRTCDGIRSCGARCSPASSAAWPACTSA